MNGVYTAKQLELMRTWQDGKLRRINLLEGSVSSGKTWISLVLWAFWVGTMPKSGLYLMCAKSLTTLKRNCLLPLTELVGSANFAFSVSAKEGTLFGRRVLLEGANDIRSEAKIRGLTLQGAYCDELTLFPEDFFVMLLSRLRVSGAKLIATTNPDNPSHWLKVKYIDRADKLDLECTKFMLDDNTTLDAEYVENLKKEYVGVFYKRFILGEWCAAEGAVYPTFANDSARFTGRTVRSADGSVAFVSHDFDTDEDIRHDILFGSIGLDFGGNGSAHAAVCSGFTKGLRDVIALKEYYRKEAITPMQLYDDVCNFILDCQACWRVTDIYCDTAETTLIRGLRSEVARRGISVNVLNARKGSITGRIRFYSMMMSRGAFFISSECEHTIKAMKSAVWQPGCTVDTRLDNGTLNVDSLDAMEYSTEPYMTDMINVGGRI
jgi:PBSX family phage terminase large subunit